MFNKNSSRDEIANVNFLQCARKLPEFAEITQNNDITPFKVTDSGTNRKLLGPWGQHNNKLYSHNHAALKYRQKVNIYAQQR